MAELTQADGIWSRACAWEQARRLPGDLALAEMLTLHGMVMNGGVMHAAKYIEPAVLALNESAYRYFGLDDVADLLLEAKSILQSGHDQGSLDVRLGERYSALIPDDAALFERFRACLRLHPAEFAPV